MTQWEYLRVYNPGRPTLDNLGVAGWELAAIDSAGMYVFKRPFAPPPAETKPREVNKNAR